MFVIQWCIFTGFKINKGKQPSCSLCLMRCPWKIHLRDSNPTYPFWLSQEVIFQTMLIVEVEELQISFILRDLWYFKKKQILHTILHSFFPTFPSTHPSSSNDTAHNPLGKVGMMKAEFPFRTFLAYAAFQWRANIQSQGAALLWCHEFYNKGELYVYRMNSIKFCSLFEQMR